MCKYLFSEIVGSEQGHVSYRRFEQYTLLVSRGKLDYCWCIKRSKRMT